MNCNNCDGTFIYVGSFKSRHLEVIDKEIILDENTPRLIFCFACRCCDNHTVMDWSNNRIEVKQNYQKRNARYITVVDGEKTNE